MTPFQREWAQFDRPHKDHAGRPILLIVALAGCGLAWAALITAALSLG